MRLLLLPFRPDPGASRVYPWWAYWGVRPSRGFYGAPVRDARVFRVYSARECALARLTPAHDATTPPEWAFPGSEGSPYPSSSNETRSKGRAPSVTRWRLTYDAYPDGSVQGIFMPCVSARGDARVPVEPDAVDASEPAASLELPEWKKRRSEIEANRRAARMVKRHCRYQGLDRLLTFTNGGAGGGWQTRKDALDDVALFLRVHGVQTFGRVPALFVAERGEKGGRWHVHMVIRSKGKYLRYSRIIRKWSRFLARRGYVSTAESGLHRFHAGDENGKVKQGFSSPRHAGRYVAKYITKTFDGCLGQRRYRLWNFEAVEPRRVWTFTPYLLLAELGLVESDLRPVFVDGRFRGHVFDDDHACAPPVYWDGCLVVG